LQRNFKEISYEIISESSLLSVSKEVEGKLQILLDGNPVKGVHLILIRIINTGNLTVLPSDYLKNLSILFNVDANILSAEITNRNPKDIDTTLSFTNRSISFSSSLLNSNDAIVVKALVSEFDGDIEVTGRIAGVKSIKCLRASVRSSSKFCVAASIASPILGFLLSPVTRWEYGFTLFSSILVSYVLIVFPISYDKKYRDDISEILQNLGIQRSFHAFVYTIIPAIIVFFGVTSNTEVKCSLGLESERACLTRIDLIIQTSDGTPLPGVQARYLNSGVPTVQYSDSNGYTSLLVKSKGDVEIDLAKMGFPSQSFNINLANNPNTVRIIRMTPSKK
jgi:hypothetical protein